LNTVGGKTDFNPKMVRLYDAVGVPLTPARRAASFTALRQERSAGRSAPELTPMNRDVRTGR